LVFVGERASRAKEEWPGQEEDEPRCGRGMGAVNQGSRFSATLRFVTESRWDIEMEEKRRNVSRKDAKAQRRR